MTRPRMDPSILSLSRKFRSKECGQAYASGPARGLLLLLTASPAKDLVILGADYSFGQLRLALARGNFEPLGRQRRPVIRLHLVRGLNNARYSWKPSSTTRWGRVNSLRRRFGSLHVARYRSSIRMAGR